MIRNRKILRVLVFFFIFEMLVSTILPTFSWALTAGPTAPEATSFEPVDTTDMVNLITGDFVYNLPLIEVPGPAGGYPLSLSYHAGIQPGEDASWVGLGWTLNPGAITRNVNGFPDDHKDVNTVDRFYWEGGETHSYSLGVNVGFSGGASAGVDLAYSKDTYQGVGFGVEVNAGLSVGNMSYSASVGVTPYGDPTLGVTFGKYGMGSIGVSTDLESVAVNAGAGGSSIGLRTDFNSLHLSYSSGVSIASGNKSFSMFAGGGAVSVINGKKSNVTTESWSIGLAVPIGPAVTASLGYRYMRYFIDQTEKVSTSGTLYTPNSPISNFDTKAYDTYSLLSPGSSPSTEPDPNFTPGASFFNYDDYSVNAQGIYGNIRPYHYKGLILRQNKKKNNEYEIKQYPFVADDYLTADVSYRFINDFSNRHLNVNGGWSSMSTRLETSYPLSVTGEYGTDGFLNNHLAGSRHVEWYTNAQILGADQSKKPFADGFIDCRAGGFDRSTAPSYQVGGFKITNESGVTYHFSLPVYAFDEYQYSENIQTGDGQTFNEFKKPEKYAYTWFLTAVTGPDFVDRGGVNNEPNQILDESDWGYWVSFNYGKWSGSYAWRNPEEGFMEDVDLSFRNYASGKKELYYLDAIGTKTHTAVFVKERRLDAKSSAYAFNLQQKSDLGFIPSDYSSTNVKKVYDPTDCGSSDIRPRNYTKTTTTVAHQTYPVSTLKLKKVYLFDNEILKKEILQKNSLTDINEVKTIGSLYEFSIVFNKQIQEEDVSYYCLDTSTPPAEQCNCPYYEDKDITDRAELTSIDLHQPDNVFDSGDILNMDADFKKALRIIDFETSYSLAPETINSFDHPTLYSVSPSEDASDYTHYGKLTLDKLHFYGRNNGADLIPPITFSYDHAQPVKGAGVLTTDLGNGLFTLDQDNSGLEAGDIIKFMSNSKECFALIQSISDIHHTLRIVGKNLPLLERIEWDKTKNPPYNSNLHDIWGLYKPDYNDPFKRSMNRYTTPISAKSVDVWSLRQVKTSLGAIMSVNYESDTYRKSIMQNGGSLIVKNIQFVSTLPDDEYSARFLLEINTEGKDLREIYTVDSYLDCLLPYSFNTTDGGFVTINRRFLTSGTVTAVTENTIEANLGGYAHDGSGSSGNTYYGGNIYYHSNYDNLGGGYRVSSISVTDNLNGTTKSMSYDYSSDGMSSGVTSYEPNIVEKMTFSAGDPQINRTANLYNYSRFENIFHSAREVPVPGVMYKTISLKESIQKNGVTTEGLSHSQYTFEVLNENMIGFQVLSNDEVTTTDTHSGITFQKVVKKQIALKDFSQFIGRLKSITTFDRNGNKISQTTNEYLHDKIINYEDKTFNEVSNEYTSLIGGFSNLGVIQESLWSGKFVKKTSGYELYGIISDRHAFPVVQTATTSVNFKTGVSTRTENRQFDFYSGQVTESLFTDAVGHSYITKLTPAYRKYRGMGPGLDGGMNMLSQEAASYTYKIDLVDDKPTGLVSASVHTWSGKIAVQGQPELTASLTLRVDPKGSDGFFPATDLSQNTKLRLGEQILLQINGEDYLAKVMTVNTSGSWVYALNFIGLEPLITSAISGISTSRIPAYRRHRTITFIGDPNQSLLEDGLHQLPAKVLPPYNAWNPNDDVPPGWRQESEIVLYNIYSHAIEASDINDQYAATKMSSDQTRVLATVANSRYNEFTYSSAEDNVTTDALYGGEVKKLDGVEVFSQCVGDEGTGCEKDFLTTHTGRKALKLVDNTQSTFEYIFNAPANSGYHASVWVNSADGRLYYSVNGVVTTSPGIPEESKKAGAWYLINLDIPATPENSIIRVWCTTNNAVCTFDDFRVCPADAFMISYVYNKWGDLSHILDNNNLSTEYHYDEMGRLKETFRETFDYGVRKTSETKYHYAGQE